jgi:hypothetical protein
MKLWGLTSSDMEKRKQPTKTDIVYAALQNLAKEKGMDVDEVFEKLVRVGHIISQTEDRGGFVCVIVPGEKAKKISPFKENKKAS